MSKYRPRRCRFGETVTAEITESRSCRSQLYRIGVWPRGAQVRRTRGWSIKPLSSGKTMLRPVSLAFFYTRPVFPLPICDGSFVAFSRPSFGLLTTPAHGVQDSPDL